MSVTPASSKWVWNSQITRVNSKGLELETKDALGVYTSAQYGYSKTTPVAIANNSSYNDMFAEGFEDNGYDDQLNTVPIIDIDCSKKHIDFTGLTNTTIVAAPAGSKAHSGKKVLKINSNAAAVKNIPLNGQPANDFGLPLSQHGAALLTNAGVNFEKSLSNFTPQSNFYNNIINWGTSTTGIGPVILNYDFQNCALQEEVTFINFWQNATNINKHHLDFLYTGSCYINVTQLGNYSVSGFVGASMTNNGIPSSNYIDASIEYRILDLNGHVYATRDTRYHGDLISYITSFSNSVCLSAQIYKVEFTVKTWYDKYLNNGTSCSGTSTLGNLRMEPNLTFYKTLAEAITCPQTKPIAATDNMINPIFSPTATTTDKKMLFSAWVKEDCSTPCYKTDYTNSNIQIWSGGTNVGAAAGVNGVRRVGPIIEGWQKVEGEFTIPAGASNLEIRFVNSGATPMYVDDIRLHPYNANMKTYVYDPINLRLTAELDANNYGKFYEYDEEGTLIRTKAETKEGIKTLTETRSAKQTKITDFTE